MPFEGSETKYWFAEYITHMGTDWQAVYPTRIVEVTEITDVISEGAVYYTDFGKKRRIRSFTMLALAVIVIGGPISLAVVALLANKQTRGSSLPKAKHKKQPS